MGSGVFDQAVLSLNKDERRDLLASIVNSIGYVELQPMSEASVTLRDPASSEVPNPKTMTWLERLWLFFYSKILRESPIKVFQDIQLSRMRQRVLSTTPALISRDFKNFLPPLQAVLVQLSQAITVFTQPLLDCLGERRREFYALMGGVMDPGMQQKLFDATRVEVFLQAYPESDLPGIRILMERQCRDLLQEIEVSTREQMRGFMRSLVNLERLLSFNFEKMLNLYAKDGTCPTVLLLKPLQKLVDIIYSFGTMPSALLLDQLFTFSYTVHGFAQETHVTRLNMSEIRTNNFNKFAQETHVTRLKSDLAKAKTALDILKKLHTLPLLDILRILLNDPRYMIQHLDGGEDWFNLYQKFWLSRCDNALKIYSLRLKLSEVEVNACQMLGLSSLPILTSYSVQHWPQTILPVYERTFALLIYFYQNIADDLCNRTLLPFLEQARFKYLNGRNDFVAVEADLKVYQQTAQQFLTQLSPQGEVGLVLNNKDTHDDQYVQTVTGVLFRNVTVFIKNSIDALHKLALVLQGVLNKGYHGQQNYAVGNMKDFEASHLLTRLAYYEKMVTQLWPVIADMKDIEERWMRYYEQLFVDYKNENRG